MCLFNPLEISSYLTYCQDYPLQIDHYVFCMDPAQIAITLLCSITGKCMVLVPRRSVFTARYGLNVWLFQPRRNVFSARYEINIWLLQQRRGVFTARYELNVIFYNGDEVCLLRGTS